MNHNVAFLSNPGPKLLSVFIFLSMKFTLFTYYISLVNRVISFSIPVAMQISLLSGFISYSPRNTERYEPIQKRDGKCR